MKIPLSVFLEYSPLRCFTIIMPMPALMETAAKTNAKRNPVKAYTNMKPRMPTPAVMAAQVM